VVNRYDYFAYGATVDAIEGVFNPFQFAGEEHDPSGLYYLRARYYDPEMGRFVSEDPILDDVNWYLYVGGNPVNLVDPWGLQGMGPYDPTYQAMKDTGVPLAPVGAEYFTGKTWEEINEDLMELGGWSDSSQEEIIRRDLEWRKNQLLQAYRQQAIASGGGGGSGGQKVASPRAPRGGGQKVASPRAPRRASSSAPRTGRPGLKARVQQGIANARNCARRAVESVRQRVANSRPAQAAQSFIQWAAGLLGLSGQEDTGELAHGTTNLRGLARGFDPRFLNPESRFGQAFYLAERSGTAIAEVAYHGGKAQVVVSYTLNMQKAKILDLTNAGLARRFGYVGDYTSGQAAARKALQEGYNVIQFKSLRGPGNNYAVIADWDEVLMERLPVPP
jgi:RHS repeat-associated protein